HAHEHAVAPEFFLRERMAGHEAQPRRARRPVQHAEQGHVASREDERLFHQFASSCRRRTISPAALSSLSRMYPAFASLWPYGSTISTGPPASTPAQTSLAGSTPIASSASQL